jgi:hypothetical protein
MAAPPFSGIIMLDLPSVAKSSPAAAACNEDGVPGRSTVDCARDGRLDVGQTNPSGRKRRIGIL